MITRAAKWQDAAKTRANITFDTGQVISGVHADSRFWQEFQDWIALGNTPDPADPPPTPPTPRQQIRTRLRADPILKAQVIDSFEARGITDKQQMLAALEAKFADSI